MSLFPHLPSVSSVPQEAKVNLCVYPHAPLKKTDFANPTDVTCAVHVEEGFPKTVS